MLINEIISTLINEIISYLFLWNILCSDIILSGNCSDRYNLDGIFIVVRIDYFSFISIYLSPYFTYKIEKTCVSLNLVAISLIAGIKYISIWRALFVFIYSKIRF